MDKNKLSGQLKFIIYFLTIIFVITVAALFASKGIIAKFIKGLDKNYNIIFSLFLFAVVSTTLYKKCIKNIVSFAEVRFLAVTTVIMFLAQIVVSNYYPALYGISGSDIGMAKETWKFIMGVLPIFFSVVLCQHFWRKMQEQLDNGEFNNSIYPTLMVAQGTFYTFLGVSAILFTYKASYSDVNSLLAGLKMAFLTSVIGLLFSIAAKLHINNSQKEWIKKNPSLDFNRPTVTEEDIYNILLKQNYMTNNVQEYMKVLIECSREQQQIMSRFAETIDKTINSNMQSAYEIQKQSMERSLREISESMIKNIHAVFSDMVASVDTIKMSCVEINDDLAGFNSNIKFAFETFSQKLRDTELALNKINDSALKLNSTCSKVSEELSGSLEKASSSFENFMAALKNDSSKMLDEQEEVHKRLAASMKFVDETISQNNAVMVQRFADFNNAMAERLKDNSDNLQNYILAFNDIAKGYVLALNGTAASIRSYNDEAKESIALYKDSIGEMSDALNNACRSLMLETEQFSRVQAAVGKDIQNITELVAITKNYSQILPRTELDIEQAKQEIIDHYKVIDKFIQDRNAEFNNKMEEAYFAHAENLNGLLNESLTIISNVLKAAQENYMRNLGKMEKEIEDMRYSIRR